MAIDRTGISSLDTGASDITYTGNEGPKSLDQMLMASADPMLVEEYKKYVYEMEEQGRQPISFREFVQQIMSGMAYGGTAKPTYTQSRKQRINAAGGGIMGSNAGSMLVAPTADGSRPGYGWLSDIKDKIVDDIIPNEIKENPALTAAVLGAGVNQFGIPFTGTPGDRMGQNWIGELLGNIPGTGGTIDMVLGGDQQGQTLGSAAKNLIYGMPDYSGVEGILPPSQGFNKLDPFEYAKQYGLNLAGEKLGLNQQQQQQQQSGQNIRWKEPLAIGLGMGAIESQLPKAPLPQDTSGIDQADIRRRAKIGSDPGLHFLPKGEVTTAYAKGGRIGYADAGDVRKDPVEVAKTIGGEYQDRGIGTIWPFSLSSDWRAEYAGEDMVREMQDYKYGKS